MIIGIDARILQNPLRGQGQYVYYLIKNLLKVNRENTYVLFYNSIRKGSFVFKEHDPCLRQLWCRVPGTLLWHTWSKFSLPCIERLMGRVDLFHHPFNFNFTHYTPIPTFAKSVVTFNGMTDPAHIWDTYDSKKINHWFAIIAERAKRIIVVSNSVKDDLLKRVKIPEERIRVIYYGVSHEFRPMVADEQSLRIVLTKYGLSDKRYILYVGAAEKNKNLSGLLGAFRLVLNKADDKDLYLVLVGTIDAPYQRLIAEAQDMGIGKRVICTDFIGHNDLPYIYNGAAMFVLPTLHEWFGIPLIEAMSCGVPVAASDCSGIPEVVGDSAVLFNPLNPEEIAKSLLRILQDDELQAKLREKGIQRAAGFTWEKTAEQTLAVYEEALHA